MHTATWIWNPNSCIINTILDIIMKYNVGPRIAIKYKRNSEKNGLDYIDTFAESTNVITHTHTHWRNDKTLLSLLKQTKFYKLSCCVKNKTKK